MKPFLHITQAVPDIMADLSTAQVRKQCQRAFDMEDSPEWSAFSSAVFVIGSKHKLFGDDGAQITGMKKVAVYKALAKVSEHRTCNEVD